MWIIGKNREIVMASKKKEANARIIRKSKKSKTKKDIEVESVAEEEVNPFDDVDALQEVSSIDLAEVSEQALAQKQEVSEYLPVDLQDVDLRLKVQDLRKIHNNSVFDIGRVLYYVKLNETFRDWGYNSFNEYLSSDELDGRAGERAYKYWVSLYEWLEHDIKTAEIVNRIKALGWAKAIEIQSALKLSSNLSSEEQLDFWMQKAESNSLRALKDILKQEKEKARNGLLEDSSSESVDFDPENDGGPEAQENIAPKNKTFLLFPEQKRSWELANEAIQKLTNSTNEAVNFDALCQQFLTEVEAGNGSSEARKSAFIRMEKIFKVKMICIDKETDTIIYGQENVDNDQLDDFESDMEDDCEYDTIVDDADEEIIIQE